jgi:hypothetical protein
MAVSLFINDAFGKLKLLKIKVNHLVFDRFLGIVIKLKDGYNPGEYQIICILINGTQYRVDKNDWE